MLYIQEMILISPLLMYDSDVENSPEAISVAATCKNITVPLAIDPAPSYKKR